MSALPLQRASSPGAKGFSIIELLVAIVILLVLATLAMNGFREVQGKADSAKCLSNLRTLTAAARLYANDHDGNFTHRDFMHGMNDISKITGEPEPGFREYVGITERTSGRNTVFTCPILQKKYPLIKSAAEYRNYGINRNATMEFENRPYKKFWNVPNPTAMAYLMDGIYSSKSADGHVFASRVDKDETELLLYPHNELNHVGFLDGHVEALPKEYFERLLPKSPFWTGSPP